MADLQGFMFLGFPHFPAFSRLLPLNLAQKWRTLWRTVFFPPVTSI
jgi:hypothetical protein